MSEMPLIPETPDTSQKSKNQNLRLKKVLKDANIHICDLKVSMFCF